MARNEPGATTRLRPDGDSVKPPAAHTVTPVVDPGTGERFASLVAPEGAAPDGVRLLARLIGDRLADREEQQRRRRLRAQVGGLLTSGGLQAVFQPIVSLRGSGVVGVEALARARRDGGGGAPPSGCTPRARWGCAPSSSGSRSPGRSRACRSCPRGRSSPSTSPRRCSRHVLRTRPEIIRLDRAFVVNLTSDAPASEALVASLCEFAGAIDATVVAEEVERAEGERSVRALGVSWAQGHRFGFPATLDGSAPLTC